MSRFHQNFELLKEMFRGAFRYIKLIFEPCCIRSDLSWDWSVWAFPMNRIDLSSFFILIYAKQIGLFCVFIFDYLLYFYCTSLWFTCLTY